MSVTHLEVTHLGGRRKPWQSYKERAGRKGAKGCTKEAWKLLKGRHNYGQAARSRELSLVSLAKRRLRGYWISLRTCNTESTELRRDVSANELQKKLQRLES